jgi:hypothetical protein
MAMVIGYFGQAKTLLHSPMAFDDIKFLTDSANNLSC